MKETDEQIYEKDRNSYLPVFARYDIVLDHGDGMYVYDSNGKKYIDFLGGIAVNVLGHAHPALVKAVSEQAGKMIHCSNLYYTQAQADAADKLVKLSGLGKVFFGNSGAEANEGAIKLARKYAWHKNPEKIQIIAANMSFHGRTYATLTATGQPHYHEGYGPLVEGFDYVDFGDIDALEKLMSEKTCAVMLETIQGEGGVYVPPDDYYKKVRALCDKYDACLILDEIQCGMGRTGTFFAYEQYGIKPDIVTLAKGLATKPECLKHVNEVGGYFKGRLEKLAEKYPALVKEVRGKGLILGMELTKPGRDIVNACLEEGAIINCTVGTVLRFVPPLIVTKEQIDELMAVLEKVLPKFA